GRVYRTSTVPSEDMQPNGALSPNNSVRWLDESLIQQSTAVIAGSPNSQEQGSTQIYLYGDAFLDYRGMLDLPSFNISGKSYSGFGQYVFWNKDASALTVIEKVDTAANAASSYGVASISPTLEAQTPFTIVGRGGASWTSLGAGAFTGVGSARVKTLAGSGSPSGLAIFGARQNGVLVSEATVPAVTPVQSGRIYVEIVDRVETGLAIGWTTQFVLVNTTDSVLSGTLQFFPQG